MKSTKQKTKAHPISNIVQGRAGGMRKGYLSIKYRRFSRVLSGLQEEWINDRPIRHAQTTGFVLHQLYADPHYAINDLLPQVIRFIEKRGIHGVDGILLTLLGMAQKANKREFAKAITTLELIDLEPIQRRSKSDFGVYFLDGPIVRQENGTPIDGVQTLVLSRISDQLRSQLKFNFDVRSFSHTSGARLATWIFEDAIRDTSGWFSHDDHSAEISRKQSEVAIATFTIAGVILGGLIGTYAAPGIGTAAGVIAGGVAFRAFGEYFVGISDLMDMHDAQSDQQPSSTSDAANSNTGTDSNSSADSDDDNQSSDDEDSSSGDDSSSSDDDSENEVGTTNDPDNEEEQPGTPVPDELPTAAQSYAGARVLMALGLMDENGVLDTTRPQHLITPVDGFTQVTPEGATYLIHYNPGSLINPNPQYEGPMVVTGGDVAAALAKFLHNITIVNR